MDFSHSPESVLLTRTALGFRMVPIEVDLELGVRGSMAWENQDPGIQAGLWWDEGLHRFLSVADDWGRVTT